MRFFYPICVWKNTGEAVARAIGFSTREQAAQHGKDSTKHGDVLFSGKIFEGTEDINLANREMAKGVSMHERDNANYQASHEGRGPMALSQYANDPNRGIVRRERDLV